MQENDIKNLLKSAADIARLGGGHTLKYFRKDFHVDRKEDDSPVTVADRETEEVMRDKIRQFYPDHGILGEEHGVENPDAAVQWILDPIDGTKSFIHGIPLYTTLVGILWEGRPVAGVIYAPATSEMCEAGLGLGCRINEKDCRVNSTGALEKALFLTSDLHTVFEGGVESLFRELVSVTRLHRTWGDAYGHMMVASGRADLMFDPVLEIWDSAALLPVITEAGGAFFDLGGEERVDTGSGISCTPQLRSRVLELMQKHRH